MQLAALLFYLLCLGEGAARCGVLVIVAAVDRKVDEVCCSLEFSLIFTFVLPENESYNVCLCTIEVCVSWR